MLGALRSIRLEAMVEATAAASRIEDIAAGSLPALAAALGASAAFFVEATSDERRFRVLGGEHASSFGRYLGFLDDDPLGRAALQIEDRVNVLAKHVDASLFRASRAYSEFHRALNLEHHMFLRVTGGHPFAPGALSIGLTRPRGASPFDERDEAVAHVAIAALRGAAQRIATPGALRAAADLGLTPAEVEVAELLAAGLSNAEIARKRFVSIETVKTHLQRMYRKLGVSSRAQALLRARGLR
jgi:DNA-binding CsgD family transcriptional regulator